MHMLLLGWQERVEQAQLILVSRNPRLPIGAVVAVRELLLAVRAVLVVAG
jgi:hypothetical protein